MRVGDKYGAHDLVNDCLPYVRRMRPLSLRSVKKASMRRAEMKFSHHHAVEALHLCRAVGLLAEEPDILVWMLFFCAQLDEHDLRTGTTRVDGTPEKLSDADIAQILALKKKLQRRGADALKAACNFARKPSVNNCELYDEYGDLKNPNAVTAQCNRGFDTYVVSCIPQEAKAAFLRGDPFEPWIMDKLFEVAERDWMCAGCFEAVLHRQLWLRKDCWDELPTLAGIDDDIDWDAASLCSW